MNQRFRHLLKELMWGASAAEVPSTRFSDMSLFSTDDQNVSILSSHFDTFKGYVEMLNSLKGPFSGYTQMVNRDSGCSIGTHSSGWRSRDSLSGSVHSSLVEGSLGEY